MWLHPLRSGAPTKWGRPSACAVPRAALGVAATQSWPPLFRPRRPYIFPGDSRGQGFTGHSAVPIDSRTLPGEYLGDFRITSRRHKDLECLHPTEVVFWPPAKSEQSAESSPTQQSPERSQPLLRDRHLGLGQDCIRNCPGAGGFLPRTP